MFAKHHYLSHSHNNAANVFIATVNDEVAGFLSVLHFPHPKTKNIKKVHRLVILPDYQGAGIGLRLLNEIGEIHKKQKQRFSIVTSAPSLIYALKKSTQWNCIRFGRGKSHTGVVSNHTSSHERIIVSFEMK